MWERGLSLTHILIFVLILILLFGARRIPDIARSLGRSIGEFKKGREEGEREAREAAAKRAERQDGTKDEPKA
jgi:sec-independent protein translocase protein TatA